MKHILYCKECDKYTMKDVCTCGEKTHYPKPPKYSPDEKYADLKRKVKKEGLLEKGLL